MKILWITNIMLPPLCEQLGLPKPVTGGWMYSSAKRLLEVDSSLQLAIATVYQGKDLQKHEVDGVIYYLLPLKGKSMQKYHKQLEFIWQKVILDFQPQLVHLHGTEYPHGLAFIKAGTEVKTVVSLQGLVSVIARYYLANMSFSEILRNITFRDIVRLNNLWQAKKSYRQSSKYEREIISGVKHVIGRTSWDKSHVWAINPNVTYHFCNETLRDEFYKHVWDYDKCEKHSIFLSQAGYPLKGLHILLKAMPLILREFPNTKIYVAGRDVRNLNSFINCLKRTGYGSYIKRLIRKLQLTGNVVFTGPLNEQQICERYLKANIFLCSSSIENSPNSLGEAQLLGVPCIASYVGGVPDMMNGYKRGRMYRFEEVEMLAKIICDLFKIENFDSSDINEMIHHRHNSQLNAAQTMKIYRKIIN